MQFGIRELVLFLTVLLLPVVGYTMVFKPQNASIDSAKAQIAHKQEMLEKLRAETARNEDLAQVNEELAHRIGSMEAMLPTNKEIDQIVRQVSSLAVREGLAPPTLSSSKPLSAAGYREQPLQMTTEGSWLGFYEFLIELEQLPRITRVTDLELEQSSGDEAEIKADFTLSIYFKSEEESS